MKTPFGTSGDGKITAAGMNDQYTLHHELQMYDTLDISLEADICTDIPCTIPADIRSQREDVFLFKTRDDLDALGYEVVSHRWRTNKDSSFRRKNIASSFHHIGNIRIIMPGETIDFLTAAEYDEDRQENYEIGYVLIDGKEEKGYGGGICGASTAVYQGTLTNTGLRFTQHRVHSKRYHGLYDAHINHAHITTPGLDSTVYA
jgi:vancomycin resistance protein YoaR